MGSFAQDLRLALRRLGRWPGLSATVILTLALGIGFNVALFSVMRAVVLRPLPYADAERIMLLRSQREGVSQDAITQQEYLFYRQRLTRFEKLALVWTFKVNLTGDEGAEQVPAATITADFFPLLGVGAVAGRAFGPEDFAGEEGMVVISHGLWQRRFGGDPGILGSSLEINGVLRTVVGVLPSGFRLPTDFGVGRSTDIFLPDRSDPEAVGPVEIPPGGGARGGRYGLALLRSGATLEDAQAELRLLNARLTEKGIYPEGWRFTTLVYPVAVAIFGPVRVALFILQAAAVLVLLIACANVANLTLSRAEARFGDMAIRAALGARRARLLRQVLTESLVLAAVGGVAGVVLAHLAIAALGALVPANLPRVAETGLDIWALGITLVTMVVGGLLCGLIPALRLSSAQLSTRLASAYRGGPGSSPERWSPALLVVTQVALAVVLVVGAALMLQSFRQLLSVDLGFHPKEVLTCRIFLPYLDYPHNEARVSFFEELVDQVESLAGIERAAVVRLLPLHSEITPWPVVIEGYSSPNDEPIEGDWQAITPGYFEVMGIALVKGRTFDSGDHLHHAAVVVINESMARTYWPDQDPLGKHLGIVGSQNRSTVVGVVADVRHNALTVPPRAQWYVPYAQVQRFVRTPLEMTLVVSTLSDAESWIQPIRDQIRMLDPRVPMAEVRTLEDVVSSVTSFPRFSVFLMLLFAILALVLATVGIYGVISVTVHRRAHDLGIRIALGAAPSMLVRRTVGLGLILVGAGLLLGLGLALLSARLLSNLLYEISARDPITYLGVALWLGIVGLGATYLPARRIAAVDPAATLRSE